MKDHILGIGGAIFDQLLKVSDAYVASLPGAKGGMEPINAGELEAILNGCGVESLLVPGGCTRNTLHGLAKFGEKCALIAMAGKDSRGRKYASLLRKQGVHPLLIKSDTPTATVLSLVTPDGERTMRTFQGASIELRGSHLNPRHFRHAKLVHLEGYTLFNADLAETAMQLAKQHGAKVSFDLASFEIVKAFKPQILELLERYVDIIFANQEEIFALTGLRDEEKGCDFLASLCETAVVLMGPRGCWVRRGPEKVLCPAYPVNPVDTTGAGDLFESGFLHGYVKGFPIRTCAHFGAVAGRAVVQVMGPVIPQESWEEIYQLIDLRQSIPLNVNCTFVNP